VAIRMMLYETEEPYKKSYELFNKLKGRNHSEDLGLDTRIISEWPLGK
jgi:hypothetical protein